MTVRRVRALEIETTLAHDPGQVPALEAAARYPALERRAGLSVEEFRSEYFAKGRPVVLEGFGRSMARRWTPDSLRSRFGNRLVDAESADAHPLRRTTRSVPMAAVIDSVVGGSLDYRISKKNFFDILPELDAELKAARLFDEVFTDAWILNAFWFAPRGNIALFHHDTCLDNLNLQVFGRKIFVVVPPASWRDLYVDSLAFSPVDPLRADLTAFPAFARARTSHAVLEEGDVIFLPAYYWHFVYTVDVSINVNVWQRRRGIQAWRALRGAPLGPRAILTADSLLFGRTAAVRKLWTALFKPQG